MNDPPDATAPGQRLILAGGGHAHVEVLRQRILSPDPTLSVQLITPTSRLAYSGMLPATIAGHHAYDDMHVDLGRLARAAGADFIQGRVIAIDADAQQLTLTNGQTLPYDLLSLDIGATPTELPRTEPSILTIPVKPVDALWAGLDELDQRFGCAARTAHIAVAGGGAGGVELTLSLAHRYRRWRQPPQLTLYSASRRLLDTHSAAVRQRLLRALNEANIRIQSGQAVTQATSCGLRLANGAEHAADAVFCATGACAPDWLAATGLALDEQGFVAVGWDLASTSHPAVFAAGDVCSLPEPRPRSGVFAVRAAPTLAANLNRRAGGRPLLRFTAQQQSLALITLGGRQAVASRGWPIAPAGYAIWRIKAHIDRRFIARYAQAGQTIKHDDRT